MARVALYTQTAPMAALRLGSHTGGTLLTTSWPVTESATAPGGGATQIQKASYMAAMPGGHVPPHPAYAKRHAHSWASL